MATETLLIATEHSGVGPNVPINLLTGRYVGNRVDQKLRKEHNQFGKASNSFNDKTNVVDLAPPSGSTITFTLNGLPDVTWTFASDTARNAAITTIDAVINVTAP